MPGGGGEKFTTNKLVKAFSFQEINRDGLFKGRSIMHAKRVNASINCAFPEVAAVDGLFMTVKKNMHLEAGGFVTSSIGIFMSGTFL
jgi:hypothetical protein